jgi:hypothetical protein
MLDIGGTIAGAVISSNANKEAADKAQAVAEQQADAIRDATAESQRQFNEQQQLTEAGTAHLQRIAGTDPTQLSPLQQRQLDDAMRSANNTLAASGLRGAGRSVTAALKDVNQSFRDTAVENNLNRQTGAAAQLSGEGFAAGRSAAEVGFRGTTGAAGVEAGGQLEQAKAGLASAGLRGAALGDISALLASDLKENGRTSRYDPDKYGISETGAI